jgi:hypothetical protein
MAWKLVPTLALAGGVVTAHMSARSCISTPLGPDLDASVSAVSGGPCSVTGSTQVCNTYGTQTCLAEPIGTVWGPCSCPSTPACTPGASRGCGNCGTQVCGTCGAWVACENEGLCKPGDTAPDGCYEGEDAYCNPQCQWVCP